MKSKILILGSTGMLGHQVVNYFLKFDSYDVIDLAFRSKLRNETIICDVTNQKYFKDIIMELKPDFIVNCIGILINGSKNNLNAIYLNAYFPHQLKEISENINAKLIHISTDCVFSGERGGYRESDFRDGKGVYAQTKILGEIKDKMNITLRTSIIGPELKGNGEGLFHWFMNQKNKVYGYTKSIWSGVTTIELAKIIKWSIEKKLTGLYHVTNNSSINKYELLILFKKYIDRDIEIIPINGENLDKSLIDSLLFVDYKIPSYEKMIKEMLHLIINNPILYSQYEVSVCEKK